MKGITPFWDGYTKDDWRDLRLEIASFLVVTLVSLGVGYHLGTQNTVAGFTEAQKAIVENCLNGESVATVIEGDNKVTIQCRQVEPEVIEVPSPVKK